MFTLYAKLMPATNKDKDRIKNKEVRIKNQKNENTRNHTTRK